MKFDLKIYYSLSAFPPDCEFFSRGKRKCAVIAEAMINVFMPDVLFALLFKCSSVQILDYITEQAIPKPRSIITHLWGLIFLLPTLSSTVARGCKYTRE